MSHHISRFDAAAYLNSEEDRLAYLQAALEENDPQALMQALFTLARAKGMSNLAQQTGISRASLYKSLSHDRKPRFETITKIIDALGYQIHITSKV